MLSTTADVLGIMWRLLLTAFLANVVFSVSSTDTDCNSPGKCGANERWVNCTFSFDCLPRNCSQLGFPVPCPGVGPTNRCPTGPGCVCNDGYLRNEKGKCILKKQCPGCGGDKNAVSGCGNCPKTCKNPKPQICPLFCKLNGCDCKQGYLFDQNTKKCVKSENCTPTCGPDEYFDTCVNGGCHDGRTCTDSERLNGSIICVDPISCKPGCLCKKGLVRNKDGICISKNKCPTSCGGDNNARPGCGQNCGRRCSNYDKGPVACADVCDLNGCDCLFNYVYDDYTKKCVLPENCTKCPKNEVFDYCPAPCPPRICSVDERLIKCAAPPKVGDPECKPGCRCADGYKRDDKGNCIPSNQCPQKCYGANEVYVPCPKLCDPNTCESIGKKYNCPLQPVDGKRCRGACRCKPGFFRNKLGNCISKANCLKCNGPNEYYSCGGACDNVCATLSQQNQTKCPIINIKCNEMCYCDEGYARNRDGICVLISTCRGCKGEHEWRNPCPPTCPSSDSCNTYKKVYNCPLQVANDTSCCKPACWCEDNFLRDKTGKCIPEEQCPCNGDPNAKPGCGCSQTCSDYCANNRPPRCNKICKINACDCKEGYVREEKSGKCILPINCPGYQNPVTTTEPNPITIEPNPVTTTEANPITTETNPVTTTEPQNDTSSQDDAVQALSRGVNVFAFDFLKQVLKVKDGENVIMSPFSCQIALAELAVAAKNNTLKQLLASFSLTSIDQIIKAFRIFLDSIQSGEGATVRTAVKDYVNEDFLINPTFANLTRDVFNSSAENINCNDPTGTADYINKWVESQTNNLIKDLISPDLISPLTRMILVNAIYFKANWKVEFNKNLTKQGDFYASNNKTTQVSMMHMEDKMDYTHSDALNAQVVRIPYKNPNYTMAIVLPDTQNGLQQTLANLNADTMKEALDNLYLTKVKLSLPSMELNTSLDLKGILQALGITDIFECGTAELQGILKTPEDLCVSAAIQKAFVKVNEEGSEAAAATGVVGGVTSVGGPTPPVPKVICDHPFLFLILSRGNPLFVGAYQNK